MDHVSRGRGGARRHMRAGGDVAEAELAPHRDPAQAELEVGDERGEGGLGQRASGRSVHDQADPVSARRLSAREIDHVTEQSADRSARDVQNAKRAGHVAGFRVS